MIPAVRHDTRFRERLRRRPADPSDANQWDFPASIRAIHFLACQSKHRLEKTNARVADCELRRVHADGESSRAGRRIVARQHSLVPLVESSIRVEREGMRRDDKAPAQFPS